MPAIAVADALRAEGAEVSFIGTRERAEAELVPAAGYEIDFLRVSGLDRRNPLKAARAAWRAGAGRGRRAARAGAPARRRRPRRRRLRRRPGRPRGRQAGPAAGADRGRQPPRPRQPHAGPARPAGLPRLPDPGPRRRPLPGHGPAGAAAPCSRPTRRWRAGASASREPADCVTVVGGSLGALSINRAAFEAFSRSAGLPHDHVGQPWVLHVAGRRDYPELRRRWDEAGRPERYMLLEYEPGPRRRARRRRPGRRAAPAAR